MYPPPSSSPPPVRHLNLSEKYNISREDSDAFALRSQQLWGKAHDAGIFKNEIEAIEMKGRKGPVVVDTDEHPRPSTKPEDLTKLKPVPHSLLQNLCKKSNEIFYFLHRFWS